MHGKVYDSSDICTAFAKKTKSCNLTSLHNFAQ